MQCISSFDIVLISRSDDLFDNVSMTIPSYSVPSINPKLQSVFRSLSHSFSIHSSRYHHLSIPPTPNLPQELKWRGFEKFILPFEIELPEEEQEQEQAQAQAQAHGIDIQVPARNKIEAPTLQEKAAKVKSTSRAKSTTRSTARSTTRSTTKAEGVLDFPYSSFANKCFITTKPTRRKSSSLSYSCLLSRNVM